MNTKGKLNLFLTARFFDTMSSTIHGHARLISDEKDFFFQWFAIFYKKFLLKEHFIG